MCYAWYCCDSGADFPWWRHQMETFSALPVICAGNSPVTGKSPAKRPVMRSFDIFFDLCLYRQLCKQSWGCWFETPLWRHCNALCSACDKAIYIHLFLVPVYSISQEMCTRFLLCCALLWLYIDWFFPYPSGLLHWHCGNLTIAPVPAKQPWWIWINTSCEFIMNDCITTTKQNTTKPRAYFLGYTVAAKIIFDECRCRRAAIISVSGPVNQLISPGLKWPPFRRRYFQVHFREWKILYFYQNLFQVCS